MIKSIKEQNLGSGKRYWKSLNDLAETPGFKTWVHREFPEGASMLEGIQRRGFVKLMAASFGLAGLGMTGCRRPEHTILPYGKSPEELIPGVPNFYATSMPSASGFQPLIVESHEGRPTKVEGNPSYILLVEALIFSHKQVYLIFTTQTEQKALSLELHPITTLGKKFLTIR